MLLAHADMEAIVVFIICAIFLVLSLVAGVRDILSQPDRE